MTRLCGWMTASRLDVPGHVGGDHVLVEREDVRVARVDGGAQPVALVVAEGLYPGDILDDRADRVRQGFVDTQDVNVAVDDHDLAGESDGQPGKLPLGVGEVGRD